VLTTLLLPLFLTVLPIVIVYVAGRTPDDEIGQLGAAAADPSLTGMTTVELGQAIIGRQFGTLFLLMPLVVPNIIAAYSIVGEKTRRTLEPLLATPLRTWELLLGKSLGALVPPMAITWLCAGVFIAGMAVVSVTPRVFTAIVGPAWLLLVALCAPLLGLLAVAATVFISSRVNDPRTAQQVSGVVVVPLLAVFFGQLSGVLVLSPALALGCAAVLALLAALAMWGATWLFQREVILTRWR
jgi:ABC-2 type transport system permease protein